MKLKVAFFILFFSVTSLGYNSLAAQSTDWILPNSKVTPGAINKDVNQNNIQDNICKANWTSTIRPPVSYTNKLKKNQLTGIYNSEVIAFGSDLAGYEEDHLISLQLGGSPTDPKNLWPQPYSGNNARKKDVVETKLKTLVCSGKIRLSVAQNAIAKNWVVAYNKYTTAADRPGTSDN